MPYIIIGVREKVKSPQIRYQDFGKGGMARQGKSKELKLSILELTIYPDLASI